MAAARRPALLGWPPTRWLRRLRPDPLRRLHLAGDASARCARPWCAPRCPRRRRCSGPRSTPPCARSATRSPPTCRRPGSESVRAAAVGRSGDVARRAGPGRGRHRPGRRPGPALVASRRRGAVAARRCGRGRRRSGCWPLAFGSYLGCPTAPTPELAGIPVPTLLLVGGVLLGLLLAAAGRLLVRGGAVGAPPARGVTAARGDREGRRRADARPGRGRAGPARTGPAGAGAGPHRLTRLEPSSTGCRSLPGCPQIAAGDLSVVRPVGASSSSRRHEAARRDGQR